MGQKGRTQINQVNFMAQPRLQRSTVPPDPSDFWSLPGPAAEVLVTLGKITSLSLAACKTCRRDVHVPHKAPRGSQLTCSAEVHTTSSLAVALGLWLKQSLP